MHFFLKFFYVSRLKLSNLHPRNVDTRFEKELKITIHNFYFLCWYNFVEYIVIGRLWRKSKNKLNEVENIVEMSQELNRDFIICTLSKILNLESLETRRFRSLIRIDTFIEKKLIQNYQKISISWKKTLNVKIQRINSTRVDFQSWLQNPTRAKLFRPKGSFVVTLYKKLRSS